MVVSTVAVGIGNYGFGLALIWVLAPRQFTVVASVFTLITVAATAANSALPWVLAREVSRSGRGSRERQHAVGFTLGAALTGGVVAAGSVVGLVSPYASVGVEIAAACTVVAVFLVQVGGGYLQGAGRFVPLALLAVAEVVLKVGFGTGLAASGYGATGAVAGGAIAAGIWAIVGLLLVGGDRSFPVWRSTAGLWRQIRGIGGVQVGVVVLTSLDVVVGSILQHGSRQMAGYQAMLVFARVPLFIAGAVSAVAYPRLANAGQDSGSLVRETLALYLPLVAAIVAIAMTIPPQLIGLVLPSGYRSDVALLLPLGIAGLAAGQINIVTTFFQAENRFADALRILAPAIPVTVIVFALVGDSVRVLAWASAAAYGLVAVVLTAVPARRRWGAGVFMPALPALAATAICAGVLTAVRAILPAWLVLAALAAASAAGVSYRARSGRTMPAARLGRRR